MKHLGISGGGTKIVGLYGITKTLLRDQNYKPEVISGVSAGAVLALPLALGKFNELDEILFNLEIKDFFKRPPVTKRGRISLYAIKNIITGKHYVGDQSNLIRSLKKMVTEEEYNFWKDARPSKANPEIYVVFVDFRSGERIYQKLRQLRYKEALYAIQASASIPVFTEGVNYNYDGGVRDHIPTARILEMYPSIKETVSVYSRPKNYRMFDEFDPKHVGDTLIRTIDIMNIEISKSDEREEDLICIARKIKQRKYYLPKVLTSVYDVDPVRLKKLYEMGVAQVKNYG